MRKCNKCNVELNQDNWYSSKQKINEYICKSCVMEYRKSRREIDREKDIIQASKYMFNKKDGKYHVYMRKDKYVGATDNLYMRAIKHKQILCVLYSTNSAEDASELEEFLHDLGYKGKGKIPYLKLAV